MTDDGSDVPEVAAMAIDVAVPEHLRWTDERRAGHRGLDV